jgi:hypothetical protein
MEVGRHFVVVKTYFSNYMERQEVLKTKLKLERVRKAKKKKIYFFFLLSSSGFSKTETKVDVGYFFLSGLCVEKHHGQRKFWSPV